MSCCHSRSRSEVVPEARERLRFEPRFRSRTRRFEDNAQDSSVPISKWKVLESKIMHLRVFRIDRVLLKCRLVFSTEAGHGSPDEPDGPTVSCCGVSCLSAVWL